MITLDAWALVRPSLPAADAWLAARDQRLRELCAVAADAVLSMPWEVTQ